jgi:hypothetical protein
MLVYGDHRVTADPQASLHSIRAQLSKVACMPPGIDRHAKLAGLFVEAGQLLQGLADADFAEAGEDRRTRTTDLLADFLLAIAKNVLRSWNNGFGEIGELPPTPQLGPLASQVELRTPEGFAFYAVYPEAYGDAARQLRLSGSPRVIGIRSIGTTLSATVAAALHASPPLSVRPSGAPFARQIAIAPQLECELLEGDAHFVIVDEGPGQSGSSFGAVADWLLARGVPLDRIAFVTSHDSAPGPQASAAHRRLWAQVQRVPATFDDFAQRLSAWVSERLGPLDAPLIDISAGEWRRHVFSRDDEWPEVFPQWERRKFLASVNGERFLLKFAGLGACGERKLAMARVLHSARFTPEPISLVHGFLIERWRDDATPLLAGDKPVPRIACYLGARARLFPADPKSGATVERLFEMACRNISLGCGDEMVTRLEPWRARLDALERRVVRVRTDNRLDRCEWLRLPGGQLLKSDALDHHWGHDLIGCQDIAWDVAGAIAEFDLGSAQAAELIGATETSAGRHIDSELLEFYRIAYVAFRVGQGATAGSTDLVQRSLTQLHKLLHGSCYIATRPSSLVG